MRTATVHQTKPALAVATATSTSAATTPTPVPTHPGDLEELQSVLHFPEEVALRITDAEYQLFYQVNFVMTFLVAGRRRPTTMFPVEK